MIMMIMMIIMIIIGSDKTVQKLMDLPFFQFILLCNSLLEFCVKFFPVCVKYNFGEVLKSIFHQDGLKSLAKMVDIIDKTGEELNPKEDISFYFRNYLVMLQSTNILDHAKLVSMQ